MARLAGIVFCACLSAAPAFAQLVDREAVFARAREAAATLEGVDPADLVPFRIAYSLTLLETGNPGGGFEVDLLLRSSRSVLPSAEVIAAADDGAPAARLESLLAGVQVAYHYRTIRVRFAEQGDAAAAAEHSSLLLNRDPEAAAEAVSSQVAEEAIPIERSRP
jgi:hypothetical protein